VRSLLKEPLVHFLLLGAALFLVFGISGKRQANAPGAIVVTSSEINALAAGFASTWQRAPNAGELEGLVQDRVREEIYAREAVALGLDKDDAIIRRRLRQKLEFVSEDAATETEPTEADLRGYLSTHQDDFRVDPRITFRHVYLDPKAHGATLDVDAQRLLAKLDAAGGAADISHAGDPFLLAHDFDAVPAGVIAKQFGDAFAAKLATLAPGRWYGPIASGYGEHLVFVGASVGGRTPAFEEVRDAVRVAWANAKRLESNEAFYRGLLAKYKVTIERPPVTEARP
jgi:hypothetical protein